MMDLKNLQDFFLCCMLVNTGVYLITVIAVLAFRKIVYKIHEKIFGLDEKAVNESIHRYLATFKLLVTVFNFAPWIALMIIR